jgi:hypothetical protein
MKVVFLDIDGVLNCTNTPNPRKFPYIVDLGPVAKLVVLAGIDAGAVPHSLFGPVIG